jgi:poly(3-hydroxybutyrate) depolymerase
MVVDIPGDPGENRCLEFSQPYINDCDFDAAGELLTHIYHPTSPGAPPLVTPEHGDWNPDYLYEFDQTQFFNAGDERTSMHSIGHIYVPESCRNGASCRLHLALHGCDQHQEAVETDPCVVGGQCPTLLFFENAGNNEWAEKNRIVVLYPQNIPWGDDTDGAKNPTPVGTGQATVVTATSVDPGSRFERSQG